MKLFKAAALCLATSLFLSTAYSSDDVHTHHVVVTQERAKIDSHAALIYASVLTALCGLICWNESVNKLNDLPYDGFDKVLVALRGIMRPEDREALEKARLTEGNRYRICSLLLLGLGIIGFGYELAR